MTGAAHIIVQVSLDDAPLLRTAIAKRIEQLEGWLVMAPFNHTDETEIFLTKDIQASLRRSLAAIDEQLPAQAAA